MYALQSIHCCSGRGNTDGDVRGVGGGGGEWDQEGDGGGGDPAGGTSSHLCHRKCDDLSGITVSPLLTLLFVCRFLLFIISYLLNFVTWPPATYY